LFYIVVFLELQWDRQKAAAADGCTAKKKKGNEDETMKKKVCALLLALAMVFSLAACGSKSSSSTKLPSGAIQLYCPFKAGGGTDLIARVLVEYINKNYNTNIVVVNQTDGGGAVCYNTVKNAKADGRVLLYSHSSMFGTYLAGGHDVNPGTDYEYINGSTIAGGYYLDVPAASPFQTVVELVDYCKAHTGEVTLGVQAGSMSNYIIAEFAANAGIEFKYVETGSGDADRVAGLLGNLFQVSLVNAAQTTAYVESGDLRCLCCLSDKGDVTGVLADVPELDAYGMKKGEVGTLCFVALPLGCDEGVKAAFSEAFEAAYNDEGVKEQLHKINMDMQPCVTGADAAAAVVENYNLYHSLAADFGLLAPGR